MRSEVLTVQVEAAARAAGLAVVSSEADAGRGTANPLGQLWSSVLMLEHLGETTAARRLLDAVERVVAAGIHTPDLGGTARTADVTEAVIRSYATEERDAAGGRGS